MDKPLISVVIPCRNEEDYIGDCIKSILSSDYPTEFLEIIVCDGLSDDRTQEIVERVREENGNVKLLLNEQQTTPHALNIGIRKSKGELVIILGAHASLSSEYVSNCVAALNADKSLGCIGGVLTNTYFDRKSEAIAKAMSHPFGVGSAHFRTGRKSGYVDTVAFGAYRREVFDKIGMFDEALTRNQDDEFNYRVLQAGYKIKLDTDISAVYHVRASFGKLFSQYFQYGYWKVYVNKIHRTITTFRQLVPLIFVLFLITFIPLAFLHDIFLKLLVVGLVFYFAGAFVSAFSSSVHPVQLIRIIASFIILHVSYGFGYLTGLIHFVILGKSYARSNGTS
ncbi:glycosyltransferase family 2 protein [Flavobacteriales bacterium AH-315-E23]|nr:glycosyltransferase family 2 protein [Flavobacteriales bacterium AH-315-E23]